MTLSYQPAFRVTGATTWIPFGGPITSTSVAITGLAVNTSYDFEITATNSVGSATSAVTTASTTTAAGGAPAGSVAGSQTTGTVDPVITGPTSGTALTSGTLAVVGTTVTDVVSSTVTTWNPSDKSPGIGLTNGNLTVTTGADEAGGGQAVRSTTSLSTGKVYFEVQIAGTLTGSFTFGLANANFVLGSGNEMGGDADSVGWYPVLGSGSPAQAVYINNNILTSGSTSDPFGAFNDFAIDIPNKLFWVTGPTMRTAFGASAWNNSATANPSTGVGGLSLATLNAGPYFICMGDTDSAAVGSLNVGNQTFSNAAPSGYVAWDGPTTVNFTTTTGTLSSTVGGSAIAGSGTASISYVNTLANVQAAIANLVFTAGTVVTSANIKIAVFDRASATNSITIPIAVIAPVVPSPPTSLLAS